jgi:hypothetical protein
VESIGFQPNSMAAITTKPGGFLAPRKTEIVQKVGALDLEIEKRSQPHTTVQTPYLAAVVKGTIFHVSVGKSKASVSVDRGLVQVTSFSSGQQANIGPRQSATVDRRAGMKVDGTVSRPTIASVAASVAVVPAVGTTALAGQAEDAAGKGKSSKANDDTSANTAKDGKGSSGKGNGNSRGNSSGGGTDSGTGSSNNSGKGSGKGNSGNGGGHDGNGGGNGKGNNGNSGGSHGGGNNSGAGSSGNNGNGSGNGNSGNGGGNHGNGGGGGQGNSGNGGGNGGGNGNGGNGNGGKGNGGKGNK